MQLCNYAIVVNDIAVILASIQAVLPASAGAGAVSGLVINDAATPYTQKQVYDKAAAANTIAPDNTGIGNIKTKTDFLPSATAGSVNGLPINGTVNPYTMKDLYDISAAIKAINDKLNDMITTV